MAAATGALGSGPMPSATWQQSMIRVKDPAPSLAFYRDVMGMTLVRWLAVCGWAKGRLALTRVSLALVCSCVLQVDKYDFPSMKFSLYFLQTLPAGKRFCVSSALALLC
jgi:hypothetical protein